MPSSTIASGARGEAPRAYRLAVGDAQLHVEDTGGPGPVVVFSHGLLWSTALFAPQVAVLRRAYRCVAFDHRGQGRSVPAPGSGPIPLEANVADAIAVIESLGTGPVHFVGLSMGGMVGMRLAARRPDLVRSLVLMDTAATPEPPAAARKYGLLATGARVLGVRAIVGRVMPVLFGRSALLDPARAREVAGWRAAIAGNRRDVARAVAGVIGRDDATPELGRIRCPTLVLVGAEDVATPVSKSEALAAAIGGARLVVVPRAGHSAPLENPEAVTEALRSFVDSQDRV